MSSATLSMGLPMQFGAENQSTGSTCGMKRPPLRGRGGGSSPAKPLSDRNGALFGWRHSARSRRRRLGNGLGEFHLAARRVYSGHGRDDLVWLLGKKQVLDRVIDLVRYAADAIPWAFRHRVVQLRQNASILEQGYASFSTGSAVRCHKFTWYPWRTSSPIRSRSGFRYTPEQVIRSRTCAYRESARRR